MITLKKVEISGFQIIPNVVTVNFEQFKSSGLYYWAGENRQNKKLGGNNVGKSTIWKAVTWCLYGKNSEEVKGENVINWSQKKASVQCFFDIDSKESVVFRSQKPNKLTVDDKEVDQNFVDDMFFEFNSFLNSVVISQMSSKFIDLPPSEKLQIFSNIVQADIWLERSDRASKKTKDLEKELEGRSILIQRKEGELEGLRKKNYDIEIEEWKKNQKEKIERKEQEIEGFQEDISKKKEEKDLLQKRYLEDQKELELFSEKITMVKKKIEDKEKIIEKETSYEIVVEKERREIEDRLSRIKFQIELSEKSVKDVVDLGSVCKSCGQEISEKFKKEQSRSALSVLQNLQGEEVEVRIQFENLTETYREVQSDISKLGNEKRGYEEQLWELKRKNESLNEKIKYHAKSVADLDRLIGQSDESLDRLKIDLEKLLKEKNPFEEKSKELRLERLKLSNEIGSLKKACAEKQVHKDKVSYWIKGFKEVRLFVIQQAIEELSFFINQNIESLGLIGWEIKIDSEKENKDNSVKKELTFFVKSPENKKLVPLKIWGGGVSQRLRLCSIFGLIDFINSRKVSKTFDIEVYDEPTQWLSEEGIMDMLEVLSDRALNVGKKLFIIDHRNLSSYTNFEGIITSVKEKNGDCFVEYA